MLLPLKLLVHPGLAVELTSLSYVGVIPRHISHALLVQSYIVYGHTIPKKSNTKLKEETWETGAGQRKETRSTQDLDILAFEECWEQLRTERLIWRRALSSGV